MQLKVKFLRIKPSLTIADQGVPGKSQIHFFHHLSAPNNRPATASTMRKAQIVFASSVVFTATTIAAVHYIQHIEAKNRRIGINRDDAERSRKRIENEVEAERHAKLQAELSKEQGVSRQSWKESQK